MVFQKELYSGIPNVAVWRVLRQRLYLKAYKLDNLYAFKRQRFRNTRQTVTFGISMYSTF
jgi:hypothetical protein